MFIIFIQICFGVLAIIAFINLMRHQDRIRLDISLVIVGTAVALNRPQFLESLIPHAGVVVSTLAFLAHPFLSLRIVQHFRALPVIIYRLAFAGLVLSWVMVLWPGLPSNHILLLLLLYWCLFEGYAAVAFIQGGRIGYGISRRRLMLVGLGELFFIISFILFLLVQRTPQFAPLLSNVPLTLIALSGGCYYLGFLPPKPLRKYWQLRTLQHFLSEMPQQTAVSAAEITSYLCTMAEQSVDCLTAVIVQWHSDTQLIIQPSATQLLYTDEEIILTPNQSAQFLQNQSATILNVHIDESPFRRIAQKIQANYLLTIPIQTDEQRYGFLIIFCQYYPLFSADDLTLLTIMAKQSGYALSHIAALESERLSRRYAETLVQIAARLNTEMEIDQAVTGVCRETAQALHTPFAVVLLYDSENEVLTVAHGSEFVSPFTGLEQPLPLAQIANIMADAAPIVIEDLRVLLDLPNISRYLALGIRTAVSLKLVYKDTFLGFLATGSLHQIRHFSTEELALLQAIADQAAVAIQNGRLYQHIHKHAEELEKRVAERTAALQAQNEELDAFAHTVAHDLKTPISHITGLSKLMSKHQKEISQEDRQTYLDIIYESGRKMNTIVEELLLLAGVHRLEVDLTPIDMTVVIYEVKMRLTHLIESHNVTIITPEEWPTALGHAPWIEEVWVNYMTNSIKYGGTPPHLECGAASLPNNMIQFWISDNGPGISPENQKQLFTPFPQISRTHRKGHGLGLSIVQRIIEKLNGTVGVESDGHSGSYFWFTLPSTNPVKQAVSPHTNGQNGRLNLLTK